MLLLSAVADAGRLPAFLEWLGFNGEKECAIRSANAAA
jgi:hypothetical protein